MANAREPALAQIKLAWWRDWLGKGGSTNTSGDTLASALLAAFPDDLERLSPLVDGWEEMLFENDHAASAVDAFAAGRAEAFVLLRDRVEAPDTAADVATAARLWSTMDVALRATGASRASALEAARGLRAPGLSRQMRPLQVLAGMAARARDGGYPHLLGDRLSPFAAMRIALIGR